jgi:serine/threonine protein kinase
MEYVAGGTLRARLRQVAAGSPAGQGDGGFEGGEILATAHTLLEALAHVHARGIAHGDLKPSNLLLRRPGAVVIADFGIAQLIGGASADVGGAPTGDAPGGTPLYLAPEQFAGAPASPATDLYAAGAIIWEMMMGRPLRDQRALIAGSQHDAAPVAPVVIARLGDTGAMLAALAAALTRRLAAERVASASDALARLPSTSPSAC